MVRKSKKRRLPPEVKSDYGRHANMFAQADELKEEALAVLHSTTNKKRKHSVRLALSLLEATRKWLTERGELVLIINNLCFRSEKNLFLTIIHIGGVFE